MAGNVDHPSWQTVRLAQYAQAFSSKVGLRDKARVEVGDEFEGLGGRVRFNKECVSETGELREEVVKGVK